MHAQRAVDRFWAKVAYCPITGCWFWSGATFQRASGAIGYGKFYENGKLRVAHRISWEMARGPIPDGQCVLHKCDMTLCVNPDHLFLGTQQDNIADMIAKGRNVPPAPHHGTAHPGVKLSVEEVLAIKASSLSQAALGARYGVSQGQIWRIRHGLRWAGAQLEG